MTGRSIEARTFGHSAQAIAETLQDFTLQVATSYYLGAICANLGDYRRAEDSFLKVVQLLEGDLSRERCGLAGFPAAMARFYLAWALAERGEFDQGAVHGREGVRMAEALDHPYSLVVASWGPGFLYGLKGELSPAARLLDRALAVCRDWKLTLLSPVTMGLLGYVYAMSGRVAEGLPLLHEAISACESLGLALLHSLLVVRLGEAHMLEGRLDDALAVAGRALMRARERSERSSEAWALRLLGEIAAHRDPPGVGKAKSDYRQALALADELGMRPLVARCHLGLGTLYRRKGRRQQAQDHLTTATSMFREMDMRFWLEQAEAEMAAVR